MPLTRFPQVPIEFQNLLHRQVVELENFQMNLNEKEIKKLTSDYRDVEGRRIVKGRIEYVGWLYTTQGLLEKNGKPCLFVGIVWNDLNRGKHVGPKRLHWGFQEGKERDEVYFEIEQGKSGSMMQLPQRDIVDALKSVGLQLGRNVDEAIQEKYLKETELQPVEWAGKQVEFVGFRNVDEEISNKLAEGDLYELDLRGCGVEFSGSRRYDGTKRLDLGGNLVESVEELSRILSQFPSLEELGLGGMVMDWNQDFVVKSVKVLSLTRLPCLEMLDRIGEMFPSLERLSLHQSNGIGQIYGNITHLDISNCQLKEMPSLHLPNLIELNVSGNLLETLGENHLEKLEMLNVTDNCIDWTEWNRIGNLFPNLSQLKCRRNPLNVVEILSLTHSMDSDDRSLLIALLPNHVKRLNGSEVDDRERIDAELWYLGRLGTCWKEQSVSLHPRAKELVKLHYGMELNDWLATMQPNYNGMLKGMMEIVVLGNSLETIVMCPESTPLRKVLSLAMSQLKIPGSILKISRVWTNDGDLGKGDYGKDVGRLVDNKLYFQV